jgi:RHS repeat-associated protein
VNSQFVYTYDSLGHELSETTTDGQWSYTYDAIGELTHAVFTSTNAGLPNEDLTYVYDQAGNRIQTLINGVATSYSVNDLNEYVTVGGTTYTYDRNGNLISETDVTGTTSYVYNAQNRLISATSPSGSWTYQYDALGNLIAVTHNGQTINYVNDPVTGNMVGEYSANGSLIAQYTYGIGLVSQTSSAGQALYYDFDALGSTVGMTNSAGAYVNQYSYVPFGAMQASTQTVPNPFQYVGNLGAMFEGSGLTLMHARFLDTVTGRFLSPDPEGFAGGNANLYTYANNDPISQSDPSGKSVDPGTVIFIIGVLGAITTTGPVAVTFGIIAVLGSLFILENANGQTFSAPVDYGTQPEDT